MRIRILGTRGKIEEHAHLHFKHSGILIDDKILIDVGEKEFLDTKPSYIFFTHLHPDHAWFIEASEVLSYPAPIYLPEKSPFVTDYSVLEKPIKIEDYIITPIPTIHSIKVKSQGYVIEKNNKRVFYTGDIAWIEKKYQPLLKNLDLVITDGSYIRKGGLIRRSEDRIYGHNGVPTIVNYFRKLTKHILFVHFGSWFMKDVPAAKQTIHKLGDKKIRVDVGYDGQEIEL